MLVVTKKLPGVSLLSLLQGSASWHTLEALTGMRVPQSGCVEFMLQPDWLMHPGDHQSLAGGHGWNSIF